MEQNGWHESGRIYGLKDNLNEDVFADVLEIAITPGVPSTCHHKPVNEFGPSLVSVEFVWQEVMSQAEKNIKLEKKETNTFLEDYVNSLQENLITDLITK